MSLVKVYAVRHEGGKDDANCWTISTDPNKTGWETDSGYDGYGLSKEDAEHYVRCINEHGALVAEVNRLHFVLFEATKKSVKWTPETKSAIVGEGLPKSSDSTEQMDEYELLRLGMFTQELRRLHTEYGFWLQNAEVYSQTQSEPLANIGAGGGDYCVQLLSAAEAK